ncbi:MAG: murein hydrolase activator EnvC family protein [Thermoanaerobaculales bacterium]
MRRLVVAVLAVMVSGLALAQEEPAPPELAKARLAVRQLEDRLRELESKQAGLGKQRDGLELEMGVAAMRVREAEEEQVAAGQDLSVASRAFEASQAEMERAREQLRLHLSLLAVLGRAGLAPLLVHALESGANVQQRVTVALALFREEKRRRDEAVAVMEQRTSALATLSRRREGLAGAARLLARRRQELGETRERVVAQLAAIERERRASAVALVGAQENEERLERLWGTVTQRDAAAGLGDVRLLRGGLRWPVVAPQLLVGFGPHRDGRYGTVTMSHGLVLRANPGERVVALARGKVSFAQFFRGYGNVVIVSHGGEIYSLYARLASMLVHLGDRVGMGDPLGIVGREDEGVLGNLYLEIRVGQNAEDPLGWLKPIGK